MKVVVGGAIVGILLVVFVFVWIYLASEGRVPVIQAPLEWVSPLARIAALVALAAVIAGLYFRMFPAKKGGG